MLTNYQDVVRALQAPSLHRLSWITGVWPVGVRDWLLSLKQ